MKQAIKIQEIPPVIGYEDSLHIQYDCPHCGQKRKMIHGFIEGKDITKIIECKTCAKKFQLFVPAGFIRSSSAWIRRMQLSR